ncbi:MAG: hypothetical protein EOO06_11960 [Chitinophagaceae bacterium]|nr:MAG: hypothetical protein EOO06_11960 [Chitinophagaceae bacterium]
MLPKIISPGIHGFLDYTVAAAMLIVPRTLNFSPRLITLYTAEAMGVIGYSALTNMPLGLKPVLSLETHKKIDIGNVTGFALQQLSKPIRKHPNARAFNLCLTLLAASVICLTDWKDAKG